MRVLRKVLLALLFSLLFGFAVGTALRLRMERPAWYLGENTLRSKPAAALALSAHPLDVADARARVLDARHHEQQIG